MASITIPGVRLNLVSNPADGLEVVQAGEFSRPVEIPGTVVRGAGGRVRVLRRAGVAREWSLVLPMLTQQQVRWLEDRAGQLVVVRHRRGHKLFGTYLSIDISEQVTSDELASVSLKVTELTFSEAV